MTTFDVDRYLRRIRYDGPRAPDARTLRALHAAHLESVPFENLDIHLRRPIILNEEALFDKIIRRRRGGFCYELNGLFDVLLRSLGFRVTRLSAGVRRQDGTFGPEFDHMTLLVQLEQRWLADVGFGESFREPLRLDEPADQVQEGWTYTVAHDGLSGTMLRRKEEAVEEGYRFSLLPRRLDEYRHMCRFHQTSPQSSFTRCRVCSLFTPVGRITLSDGRLIVTESGTRHERPVTATDWHTLLVERFGFDPAEAASIAPALRLEGTSPRECV
jgi:N-hydroxyarylamine O-acetyltransferase